MPEIYSNGGGVMFGFNCMWLWGCIQTHMEIIILDVDSPLHQYDMSLIAEHRIMIQEDSKNHTPISSPIFILSALHIDTEYKCCGMSILLQYDISLIRVTNILYYFLGDIFVGVQHLGRCLPILIHKFFIFIHISNFSSQY